MKTKARKKNVIYEEKFTGYYFPEKHFMKILDYEVPLVIFTDDNFRDIEPEKMTSCEFSKEGIEKIKTVIGNAKFLFNDAPLEESDYIVLDGGKEEYFFRSDKKETCIVEDNFSIKYSDMPENTKAGEILSIVNSIYSILKEYNIEHQ